MTYGHFVRAWGQPGQRGRARFQVPLRAPHPPPRLAPLSPTPTVSPRDHDLSCWLWVLCLFSEVCVGLQGCRGGAPSPRHPLPPPWVTVPLFGPRARGSSSFSAPCWTHLPSRNQDLYTHSLKLLDMCSQTCFSPLRWMASTAPETMPAERLPPHLPSSPRLSVTPGGRRCGSSPLVFCECSSPSGQGPTLGLSLLHPRIWGASLEGKGRDLNAPRVDGVGRGPCFCGFPGPSARPSHRHSPVS